MPSFKIALFAAYAAFLATASASADFHQALEHSRRTPQAVAGHQGVAGQSITGPIFKIGHDVAAPIENGVAPIVAPILKAISPLTGDVLNSADCFTRPLTGQTGCGGGLISEFLGPLGGAPLTGHLDPEGKDYYDPTNPTGGAAGAH